MRKFSSSNWAMLYNYIDRMQIIDPDGWDRSSPTLFERSWNEPISQEEFEKRMNKSTVRRYRWVEDVSY